MSDKDLADRPPTASRRSVDRTELVAYVDRELGARMRARALRFARTREDAEDAYQAALERLWRWGPTDSLDHAVAWFRVVVRNEVGRLYRRNRVEPVGDLEEPGAPADPRPGPAELAEQRERLERLREIRAEWMRPLYAVALGWRREEISKAMSLSRRQVRKRIGKARQAARELAA